MATISKKKAAAKPAEHGAEKPLDEVTPDETERRKPFDVVELRVEDVYPDEDQPRMTITNIEELADSMLKFGQLTPILVRRTGNTYRIIGGERRWTAAKLNGTFTILARVADSDDAEASLLELADNQHVALTDVERSRGAQRAFTFDAAVERIAAATGRTGDALAKARRGFAVINDPTVAEELTLDDLITVDELADDAKAVVRYLAAPAGSRAYTLSGIRNERINAEKHAALIAVVKAAGLTLLKQVDYTKYIRVSRGGTDVPEGATAAFIESYGTPTITWWKLTTEAEADPEAAAEQERRDKARQELDAAHDARLLHIATTTEACKKQYERLAEAAWEGTGAFADTDREYEANAASIYDMDTNPLASLSGFHVRMVASVLAMVESDVRSALGYELGVNTYYAGSAGAGASAYFDLLTATGYKPNEIEVERIAAVRYIIEANAKAQAENEAEGDGDE